MNLFNRLQCVSFPQPQWGMRAYVGDVRIYIYVLYTRSHISLLMKSFASMGQTIHLSKVSVIYICFI